MAAKDSYILYSRQMAEPRLMATSAPTSSESTGDCIDDKEAVIAALEKLKDTLDDASEILEIFHSLPFTCLSETTKINLCYRLDNPSDIPADNGKTKDYLGIAEWADLERVFIRYLSKTECRYKTIEVLAKWNTEEKPEPKPNLGNLQQCLCGEDGIDREDVITDMAKMINKDAYNWKMEKCRAKTTKPAEIDDSWQLTRQDVISGRRTYYTCCLVYADEDEGMASIITNMYRSATPNANFFSPQFDLKVGKYVYETTAQVIQERCKGRVIFIISRYFIASPVCRFTVQFAKTLDIAAEQGNLIPFRLDEHTDNVPKVLLGIAGVRWYKKNCRKNAWGQLAMALTCSSPSSSVSPEDHRRIQQQIQNTIDSDPDTYLGEPPYEPDTPEPGSPISVYDPDISSSNEHQDSSPISKEEEMLVADADQYPRSRVQRIRRFIRKKIVDKVFTGRNPSK